MSQNSGHRLRIGRVSEVGRIYLITTVTRDRKPLFNNLWLGRNVVNALRRETPRAATLTYVVMPDHLHWLLQLNGESSLSQVVANVKSASAFHINRHRNDKGPVWQRGFHDHAVRTDEDVKKLARYVIANPLRAGIVQSINEYSLWDASWI